MANQKVDGKVVTLITYNKGRDWDRLRPPSTDMNGKPTNCKPVSASAQVTRLLGGGRRTLLQEPEGRASEQGHPRGTDPRFLCAQGRGSREAPCFMEEFTGVREGSVSVSSCHNSAV